MRKMLFLFSAIIMLFIFVACSNENDDNASEVEETVTPVETEQVKKGDLTIEQTIFGSVLPKRQIPVMVEQPGEITDLKVKTGDEVQKDERLATIKTPMGSIQIKAPSAGTVGQLALEENDFYNGEEPFAIIFDDETVTVQFSVTSEMKDKFKVDKKYKTIIAGKKYEAQIKRIESLPNETGQYDVVAHIDNEKGNIQLGSVAEVGVKDVLIKDTTLVPTEAIVTESDETYVYIVEDSTAKKVAVEILETQTEETAIEADIKEKIEIITSGQFLLTDGSEVDVIKDGK